MYNIILEGSKGQKVPVLLEDYLIYYAWYWKTLASTCNNTDGTVCSWEYAGHLSDCNRLL